MITVLSYIALENFVQDWSGWLLVLPVLTDLAVCEWIDGRVTEDKECKQSHIKSNQ